MLVIQIRPQIVKPVGLFLPNREVRITVLATADLHGGVPVKLAEYVQAEKRKDKDVILVDAGDFYDGDNGDPSSIAMRQWFQIYAFNPGLQRRTPPIVSAMAGLGYDAVVLGNHEFVANDRDSLGELLLDFTDYSIPVLSANLYTHLGSYKVNYITPYIIKNVETDQGVVKVGILGLTIKEVGEAQGQRELMDLPQYQGALELTDIVQEVNSKKWPEAMRYNGADIVIAVVHAGEESENSKNPGNRIKALAESTDGIDAIVAAHTHVNIPEHKYKNRSGQTVIVTQPGRYGEYVSKISFSLVKKKERWEVVDKNSLTHKI
ncbi:MAG TPA: hypothetical protein GXX19_13680 [Syntrophomonadaceae bacterium]|nr:hypothetical protein [Syntrophomonadaceae bacterium]